MITARHVLALGAALLLGGCADADPGYSSQVVRGLPVITIYGEIGDEEARGISDWLDEVDTPQARAIIIEIDTPGGTMAALDSLARDIQAARPEAYALVRQGEAGAAMLAFAADHIYMCAGSKIGPTAPLDIGGLAEVERRRVISLTEQLMAEVASTSGHDPMIARSMVNADHEYRVDGKVFCRKGQLLSLTSEQAEAVSLSEGTFDTVDELADHVHALQGQ